MTMIELAKIGLALIVGMIYIPVLSYLVVKSAVVGYVRGITFCKSLEALERKHGEKEE